MRTLIDGYNLMHALGLMNKRLGPGGLHKVRHRFLNDLAAALDPIEAHQTTVVFDAAEPPTGLAGELRHKALTVIFAVDDESADERIEVLIAQHSAPKTLTVVSSDHRVQAAARHRKAGVLGSDEFWSDLEDRKARKPQAAPAPPSAEELAREHGLSSAEADYWLEEFADLAGEPEAREAFGTDFSPSPDDIARIEREVDREFP
jgi:predicted RNA-binding protein with PIN domain